MVTSIQDWISLLREWNSAAGFPLIVGGLSLMLFGWRMWKICVVLSFGLIGTMVAARIIGPSDDQLTYALACGTVLGLLSYWPGHVSVAVLGGVIGGVAAHFYLENLNLSGGTLWTGVATAFVACTAIAVTNRRHVVILVTAFLGAALLLSGLTSWLMNVPGIIPTFRAMAKWSAIVVPFLLLVPTVMSCFYQVAEIRRLQVEL